MKNKNQYKAQSMAIALEIVNRPKTTLESVLAMGLDSCNVRCLSTNIAKGKYLKKGI